VRRDSVWLAPLLVILAVSGFLSLRHVWRASAAEACDACQRPIHDRMRAVAVFEGKREAFCCPACALTAHRQTGRAVRMVRFTDFDTQAKIPPERAFLVRDSDVNMCVREHVMIDEEKHASGAQFDRCAPSIVAFGTRGAAERFVAAHGGRVVRFQELAAAFAK
jgi:hypothetical protein